MRFLLSHRREIEPMSEFLARIRTKFNHLDALMMGLTLDTNCLEAILEERDGGVKGDDETKELPRFGPGPGDNGVRPPG